MEWLKADSTGEKISGTGLLLAPVNPDTPSQDKDTENFNFAEAELKTPEEKNKAENSENENLSSDIFEPDEQIQDDFSEEDEDDKNEDDFQNFQVTEESEIEPEPEIEEESEEYDDEAESDSEIQNSWNETAGFALNLNEPPPELWTRISENEYEDYEEENEDEELDYEQGMSLQGAAYVPKSKNKSEDGKNFTEKLHKTLRGRKQKAEQLREQEEKKPHHPYRSRAVIISSTLLMLLGFAFLALWFIQQWTPSKINERANAKLQNGDYEGAMTLFQRGYKRYPYVLTFLTGLAKSSELAGHIQTANTAWEAYINLLPDDDIENKTLAQLELSRINGNETSENKKEEDTKEKETPPEAQQTLTEKKEKEKESGAHISFTFDDFLREGNEAYNLKLYNSAVIYFHRAIELNGSDVRAYIGLAASYRAKRMYFDAKRILDEARRKFKWNPTIETELKILERE